MVDDNRNVTETRDVDVDERGAVPAAVVLSRLVWLIAGLIIGLLVLRMVLLLLGANPEDDFVSFIYQLSGFFAAPFFGIFSYEPSYGSSVFELSTLVAIAVYALLAWGISRLLTLGMRRPV